MSTTLATLKTLANLAQHPVPGFTCPLIDQVLGQINRARRQTWDIEKKTEYELHRALAEIEVLLQSILPLMERIRFANAELREVAEPASELAKCAEIMLKRFQANLMQQEQLTVEQIDAILDAGTYSDEATDEDGGSVRVKRVTYLPMVEAEWP